MVKYSDAAGMSEKDLHAKVATLKTEMFNAKFAKHTVGTASAQGVRNLKKDIARLLTALNSKKN
jgi:ribosomal protein L29